MTFNPAIILPTIGRESLDRAIQSIMEQNHKDWHLYIVGDGIQPSSRFLPDSRITILRVDGPGYDYGTFARNYAINHSNNEEWICHLDDDDLWLNHHLRFISDIIKNDADIDIISTSGQEFRMKHKHPRTSKLVCKMGRINTTDILTPGLAYKRELFNKTGGWQYSEHHDLDLWNEMIDCGGTPLKSDVVTFIYER